MKAEDERDDYVTLSDAFHPDRAAVIAERLSEGEKNKWGVVLAEAKLVPDAPSAADTDKNHQEQPSNSPGIVVEPIPESPSSTSSPPSSMRSSCRSWNLIAIIVGWSMMFASVATTLGMELAAAAVFVLAAGFYWVALECRNFGGILRLFECLLLMPCYILQLVDFILLTTSIMVAELLGRITQCLLILFGGCDGADTDGHQNVRKLCHLVRWAFRDFHEGWSLERKLPWDTPCDTKEKASGEAVDTTGSVETSAAHDDVATAVATPIDDVTESDKKCEDLQI